MTNTAWDQPSSYFESLTNTDQADYKRKLTLSTSELLSDPFTIKNWKCDESLLPDISWPDIYNYLIEYPSVFSKESLKAYELLEGHNFFISGHVQEAYYQNFFPTNQEFCFIKSEVLPSQHQGSKQKLYKVWVCTHKQKGWILTAKCTCMAWKTKFLFTVLYR